MLRVKMGLVLQDLHKLFNVLILMVVFIDITGMSYTKDTKTQLLILQQCIHCVAASEDDL